MKRNVRTGVAILVMAAGLAGTAGTAMAAPAERTGTWYSWCRQYVAGRVSDAEVAKRQAALAASGTTVDQKCAEVLASR
ncbi:MAG TPA: hypothetical protein VM933_04445 [Acidimicrobiales bacterium]|nr:hypothetical protein [Acidimicrobiales bacterium]